MTDLFEPPKGFPIGARPIPDPPLDLPVDWLMLNMAKRETYEAKRRAQYEFFLRVCPPGTAYPDKLEMALD